MGGSGVGDSSDTLFVHFSSFCAERVEKLRPPSGSAKKTQTMLLVRKDRIHRIDYIEENISDRIYRIKYIGWFVCSSQVAASFLSKRSVLSLIAKIDALGQW